MAPPAPLPPSDPVRLLTREYIFRTAGSTVVTVSLAVRPKGRRLAVGCRSSSTRDEMLPLAFRAEEGVTRCGVMAPDAEGVRFFLLGLEKACASLASRFGREVDLSDMTTIVVVFVSTLLQCSTAFYFKSTEMRTD